MDKKHNHNYNHNSNKLSEGLEIGDLDSLVDKRVTIDEYRSKIGADDEIVVVSFKVQGHEPALDLVNFIEKSYEWVLDADASSGELDDGDYVVFVECDRDRTLGDKLYQMFEDLENLTGIDVNDWLIVYHKPHRVEKLQPGTFEKLVPLTKDDYNRQQQADKNALNKLKSAAGLNVESKAPKNQMTENLRIAAGIR